MASNLDRERLLARICINLVLTRVSGIFRALTSFAYSQRFSAPLGARKCLSPNIALSLPHFLAAAFAIASTHLIATLPERLARLCAEALDLHICSLPFEMVGFSVDLLWHIKNNNDPSHVWLRTILVYLCVDCEH